MQIHAERDVAVDILMDVSERGKVWAEELGAINYSKRIFMAR